MRLRERLEAHARLNREELAAGKPRTPLPEDLRDLRDANLRWADLRGANLRDADLTGADLTGADLREANLRKANLREANFSEADLRDADLTGADLTGADLRWTELPEGFRIASLCFGGWVVTVTPTETAIGCQTHPNENWLAWGVDAPEIAEMHENAAAWWKRHREAVCAAIRDVMAEPAGGAS